MGGLSFGVTEDGKPGYKEAGADAVTPFKKAVDTKIHFGSPGGYQTDDRFYATVIDVTNLSTLRLNGFSVSSYGNNYTFFIRDDESNTYIYGNNNWVNGSSLIGVDTTIDISNYSSIYLYVLAYRTYSISFDITLT